MKRRGAVALAAALLCALGACMVSGETAGQGDERVRLRAAAFYSAWAHGKADTIRKLVSQNFRDNDPDLASFRALMDKTKIKSFQMGDIQDELKLKRVTVNVTKVNGEATSQVSYWKFERGDWYLEVID
jgi:hypothetical protein